MECCRETRKDGMEWNGMAASKIFVVIPDNAEIAWKRIVSNVPRQRQICRTAADVDWDLVLDPLRPPSHIHLHLRDKKAAQAGPRKAAHPPAVGWLAVI